MTYLIQKLQQTESRHPNLAAFLIAVGMPVLTLLAVLAAVTLIMLPFAFLCGWF